MRVRWLTLLLVIGASVFVSAAMATLVEEKEGYVVTTVDGDIRLPEVFPFSSSSIEEGQTHWYSTFVPAGKTAFFTDLYWGVPSNSLSLTILAPGAIFGPYYDSADGRIDGRINLRISRSGGLASGTWWSTIYGYHVTGVQSYTYTVSVS